MRQLAGILLAWLSIGTGYAEVFSWIDENGVKHFSNTPPPASATHVTESKEIVTQPGDKDTSLSKEVRAFEGPSAVDQADSVPNPTVSPADSRQQALAQIDQEQKRLAEKLAQLNKQIISAEHSRTTSSSYEYQDWTNRIEQLKREIATETEQSNIRIRLIKNRHGISDE